jgi:hypothetical protein
MRSPAGRLALATWAFLVVPTGMPLIAPDMSDDMSPGDVSWETAVLDGSEPLVVCMSSPLGCCGATVAASTAAYFAPPSRHTKFRPLEAACSPVALDELAGSGADPAPGA